MLLEESGSLTLADASDLYDPDRRRSGAEKALLFFNARSYEI